MPKSWWIAATAVIVLRAAMLGLFTPVHRPLVGDEPHYKGLAQSLLQGKGFTYRGEPLPTRAPGYPVVLAGVYAALGEGERQVAIVQGLLDGLSALIAGALAWRVFGAPVAGALAFLMVMFWPSYVALSLSLYAESTFMVFMALTVWAFAKFNERPAWKWAMAAGALGAISAYARPTGPALLAGLSLGWLVTRWRDDRRHAIKLLGIGLGFMLVMFPWSLRNKQVYGSFTTSSIHSGEVFYLGSLIETRGRWIPSHWHFNRSRLIGKTEFDLGRPPTVAEMDSAFYHAGMQNWRRHPIRSLEIGLRRVWRLVFVVVTPHDQLLTRIAFLFGVMALYGLAAISFVRGFAARAPNQSFAAVLGVALLFCALAQSLFFTLSRYYEPLRLMAMVLAAGTLYRAGIGKVTAHPGLKVQPQPDSSRRAAS